MSAASRTDERNKLVGMAMGDIRAAMDGGPSMENLAVGKAALIKLAMHKDLFSFEDFPLPNDDAMECSYLIHEDDDGEYALYINSGAPHQYYAPHDHGTAWAIIAGVQGRERHKLYLRRGPDDPGEGPIRKMGEVIVASGEAATMQPDGIHEVNAMDGKPLLHLHLYARNFI
ncbi:MAG: cysteine dioxygenase family protein, partial [Rhodospirillaceae bacterium]|nr:cysteine dioxygenase family protein [Rhodospirillaceae bacterium]